MGIQVKLSHIELEGFKSFRDKTVIGPLGDFTCIVGPNGCGKSVVGEAIAFALGGNRKMLRSGSLADLLNQERRAAGCRTAQVTLRLELIHEKSIMKSGTRVTAVPASDSAAATPAVNASSRAAAAAAADPASTCSPDATVLNLDDVSIQDSQVEELQDQKSAAVRTQRAAAEVQAPKPRQWLGVRRNLRGDTSETLIKQPDSNTWVQVNQTELQHELAAYNMHTKGVDRYIVTQSRQAVNVGDPVGLVKYLEFLTGTGDYESRIQEQSNMIEQMAGNIDETQQQIASLEYMREQLAPHVAHWQLVQQQQAELLSNKVQLLREQQQHGSMLMQQQQHQVDAAEASATEAAEGAARLTAQQITMQQQEAGITQQLQATMQKEQALRKKVSRLTAAAAASKVQLSCSSTALKSKQALAQKLQEKLAKLRAEEAQHKEHIAEAHLQLRQLQETEAAAEQQLTAVRHAAEAEGAQQQSLPHGSKPRGGAGRHAGPAAAVTAATPAERSAAVSHQVQALQQQLDAADAAVGEARLLESTAADRATRAAISLQGYQSSKAAAEAIVMTARQQWQQAVAATQAADEVVHAGQSAMHAAEQQWKAAILQERHLQEEIQAAQAEQQQWQQELNHPGQWHNRSGGTAASSACDSAVQQLKQQSDLQQIPGVVYGRLCNVLSVSDASAAVAVNTALAEIANLNATLVVSSRQAAAAAIDHFRRNKIGTVQCKILSEISARAADSYAGNSGSSSGCRPLLEFVTAVPGVPGLQQLLQQLLGNWLLGEDRQTASRMLHLCKNVVTRIGEVFKADGEVVVNMGGSSSGSNNSYRGSSTTAYSLKVGQPEAVALPAAAAESAATEQKAAAVAAVAAAKAAQQRVFELQKQLFAASGAAAATHAQLQAARDACCKQKQQVATAQRHERRMRSQYQAEEAKSAQLMPQLQQQIDTSWKEQQRAATSAAEAIAALQRAVSKQQQLEQLLLQQTEADGGSSRRGSSSGAAAVTAAAKSKKAVQPAEAAYATATAAVSAAWADADRVKGLQKRAATKAAAAAKELAKVQATEHKQQELQQLQAKHDAEQQQQLAAAQSGLQAILADRADLASSLKPVQKQLAAASKAADAASQEASTKKVLLQQHLATLQDLQLQQQQRNTALQELLKQQQRQQHIQPPDTTPARIAAPAAAAMAAATAPAAIIGSVGHVELNVEMADAFGTAQRTTKHHQQQQQQQQQNFDLAGETQQVDLVAVEVQGRSLRSRKLAAKQQQQQQRNRWWAKKGGRSVRGRRVLIDSSSSEFADGKDGQSSSSDSASDTQGPQHSRPPGTTMAAAAAVKKRKKGCQQQRQQEAVLPSAAALAKQGQQLQVCQQQLDDQQHALQQQVAKVNESALEQDVKALQGLATAHGALRELEQQHNDAVMTQEQLLDERYNKLLEVLQALNSHLDGTYRQLTGGCGSAYCAYTEERRLLFSQGVTLHVQPDGVAWRQFSMLSGGQQALAALALSFALQALFPSPFYFFDEVDCALDSLAAGRVAAYVKAQCSKSPGSSSSSSVCGSFGTGLTDRLAVATKGASSVSSSSAESSHPAAAAAVAAAVGRRGAQYLLVSHRPVVFESAGCLLGVYSNGCGSSSAVVAHF